MRRWTRVVACFVLFSAAVGGLLAGCDVAGAQAGAGTHVVYVLTNRSGGEVKFDLEANGKPTESASLASETIALVLDDCAQLDEFRMRMVCTGEGADCSNLGIIIDPSEIQCGDVIDVYIDPAVEGQLQLSAYRRNQDGTPGESSNSGSWGSDSSDSTGSSNSGNPGGSSSETSTTSG